MKTVDNAERAAYGLHAVEVGVEIDAASIAVVAVRLPGELRWRSMTGSLRRPLTMRCLNS